MELIDTEQRARRLARTVTSDIVLYNEKRLSAGEDLSPEIAEGRSHFCARVTPSLHWIFEDVLNTTKLRKPSPVEEPRMDAAPAEPAPAKPAPAKPAPPRPAPAQPPLAKPAPPRPAPAQPLLAKLAPAKPAPARPALAEGAPAKVVPAEPMPVEPILTEPAPPDPTPVEPALVDPAPIKAASADVRASTPVSERTRAMPSEPPRYQEPDQLESEELPSLSSPPPAQPEPSMVTSSPSNARSTLVLVFCLIGIALAIGWLVTR